MCTLSPPHYMSNATSSRIAAKLEKGKVIPYLKNGMLPTPVFYRNLFSEDYTFNIELLN